MVLCAGCAKHMCSKRLTGFLSKSNSKKLITWIEALRDNKIHYILHIDKYKLLDIITSQ